MKRTAVTGTTMMSISRTFAASLVFALVFLSGCRDGDAALMEDLKELELADYQGRDVSEMTVDELERALRLFRDEIERKIRAAELAGSYHKILGLRYLGMEMYALAYEQFKAGLEIYPSNYILAYYAGACAARRAKSLVGTDEQAKLYREAEEYYLLAIDYSPNYVDALYGLAVLYVFELDRTAEARQYLERIVAKESRNFDAMFLLARVYAAGGRIDEAVQLNDAVGGLDIDLPCLHGRIIDECGIHLRRDARVVDCRAGRFLAGHPCAGAECECGDCHEYEAIEVTHMLS